LFPTPANSSDAASSDAGDVWTCPSHVGEQLHHLPPAAQLPVVVAARISLSFPGLLSAIPLYYVDHSRPAEKKAAVAAWFSDGGIASNFPMHFFDRLWPRRPTFGINLQPDDPDYPQKVWRAATPRSGLLPRVHAISSMGGFIGSILDTMQNWNDTTQLSLPGFRDRVVEVRTSDNEGGMNLKMLPETIRNLANRGADAAALLDTFDFELHRWIRYRVAMNVLDDTLTTLTDRYPTSGTDEGYKDFIHRYGPKPKSYKFTSTAQQVADEHATEQLMATAAQWVGADHPAVTDTAPHPRPVLRLVPPR
jgi:hypothetical protein